MEGDVKSIWITRCISRSLKPMCSHAERGNEGIRLILISCYIASIPGIQ